MTLPRLLIILAVMALPFIRTAPGQGSQIPGSSDGPKPMSPPEPVQIDVGEALNTRVVTTAKDGALIPLSEDIDGAGGLATKAASDLMGNKNAHPLPDNATFAATDRHPQVVLHFSNENSTRNQARRCVGENTFDFAVPAQKYAHLHVFLTSGQGASNIVVKLVYEDGSVDRRDLEVPDWFWELKNDDAYRSYLAVNLGKWSKDNKMIENDHHYIFALDVTPSPAKALAKVYIHKTAPGLMVFWGATGTPAR